MRRLRRLLRRSATSPEGRHSLSLGVRVGYWPCLRGPFVTFSFWSWHLDVWWGLPSNLPAAKESCS